MVAVGGGGGLDAQGVRFGSAGSVYGAGIAVVGAGAYGPGDDTAHFALESGATPKMSVSAGGVTGIRWDADAADLYAASAAPSGTLGTMQLNSSNRPPAADAGADRTVREGDIVTLSGTASDPDGDHMTYGWSHGSNITLNNAGTLAPSFTAPQVTANTTVSFTLTVTDPHNLTSSDTMTVTIYDVQPNRPPAADAGADRTVREGDIVTLSGTASDPDGDHMTYGWSHGSNITLNNAGTLAPSFTAPQVTANTTVSFTLTVTDPHNLTSSDTMTVTIYDVQPNRPPAADAGADRTVREGDIVTLSGTASDPDGDHMTYGWSHGSNITLNNAGTLAPSFTAPQVTANTTVSFTLTVTDPHNLTSSDTMTVTIYDVQPNRPPAADAGADRTVREGDIVTLSGTASDPDGDHMTYGWSHGSNITLNGAGTLAPSFTAPQVTANTTVSFTLTVTDPHNLTSSDTMTVTIYDVQPNRPPAADAGADRTVREGDIVTLSGTASDPDGDHMTYGWSHGSNITLNNAGTLAPSFTAPQVTANTTVSFTLTVTDPHNLTSSDTMTVTIYDVQPNRPPAADAGADRTVREGDIVTLSGTASDPDGDHMTYGWSHGSNITLNGAGTLAPSFTAPQVTANTTVSFTLTVTDPHNLTSSDTMTVTIYDVQPNRPPAADAGADRTVREGDIVTLSGTASDPDGDHMTYGWSHGSNITLNGAGTLAPSFTAPQVTTNTTVSFTLTVTDPHNLTSSDTVTVTIYDVQPNRPPAADAGADRTVREGDTVTLSGTASDPDGDHLVYGWSHGSNITLNGAGTLAPSFTAPQVTTNTTVSFTLTVTDPHNLTSSDTMTVTIYDVQPNRPPAADAGADRTVREGDTVTLNGTASDPDGDHMTYGWSHGSNITLAGADTLAPSFTAPQVTANTTVSFTLTVTDPHNLTSSDTVTVTVTNVQPNRPPAADAGADRTVREGDTVTLAGTASDPDGDHMTYGWSHGSNITLNNAGTLAPSFTAPQVTTNTTVSFTLTVTDPHNLTSSDTMTVTITDAGSIPISNVTYNTVTGELRLNTDHVGTLYTPADHKNATLTDDIHSVAVRMANAECLVPAESCAGNDATGMVGDPAKTWFAHPSGLHVTAPAGVLEIRTSGNATGVTAALNRTAVTVLNPAFAGAAYHTGNGTVSIWFGGDISMVNGSLMHAYDGANTVRFPDAATVSGNVAYVALPGTDRDLLEGAASLKIYIKEGAVTGAGAWPNAAVDGAAVDIFDGTKPEFRGAAYHTGNGTISIRFSEDIDMVNGSLMRVYDGANAARLPANASASGDTVTATLGGVDRDKFANSRAMYIEIQQGAVADRADNQIDESPKNAVAVRDTTKPAILGAIYHIGNGTISIRFSEDISTVNGSLMSVTGGTHAASLDGAAASGSAAAATLGFADMLLLSNATSMTLAAGASAARDASGNPTDAVRDVQVDLSLGGAGFAEIAGMARVASFGAGDFVTTWNTTSSNEAITIHVGGHTGTYTVNWGDGTNPTTQSGNATHAYASAGSYNVTISGDFERFLAGNSTNAAKLVALVQWGNATWSSMYGSFEGASNMIYKATDAPDLSRVANMSDMFNRATSFNGNIWSWDVSSVTDMSEMFGGATSFNGDISTWNVSSVTDMSSMFDRATSFNRGLSTWDVSSVTDMSSMFDRATSFNRGLSTWDVSSVTDMSSMFDRATSFNRGLSTWDVSSVTDMSGMFGGATSFNGNLSTWDVSSVTDMSGMFGGATSFNGNLSTWDVSSVTDMSGMFISATSFNGNLSTWDVSSVTIMASMFVSADSFNGNLSTWDVSKVTDMHYMFGGATSFNGNLSAWDVSKVTDMHYMFGGATSFNGNLSAWDVSKVTDMHYMFGGATSFNGNLSAWDVSSVTDMSEMFADATSFNGNLSAWDVSKVTDMHYMFNRATSFNQNLGPWYVVLDSRFISNGTLTVGGIAAQNTYLDGQTPTYSLVAGAGDADNSLFTISDNTLSIKQSPAKSTYHIRIGASGNNLFGSNNAISVTVINDTTKPTFSSAAYTTGSGQLAITFSEPLDASKHVPTKLHIREFGSNTGGVTLSNGTITTNGTNSLTITLSNSDRTTVAGLTTPQLDIDAGAVSDTSGNAIAAAADQTITINDTIRPTFSSATYTTGSGELAITFSEPLDASKHVPTKLHIRASGSNTGGVTLSNGTITANGTNSLTITLSNADRTTVAGLTTPQLDIDAGAVSDTSGNQIAAAADQTITINDTIRPTFSSAAYATGSGQLAITFSEPLDSAKHVATKLHVRESGSSTGGVTLSNGTITTNGTNSLTITLSNSDRTAVAGLTTPQLDIDAGAVSDTSGNAISAAADQTITIQDTTKPTFTSATYTTGSGELTIAFSEPLDASKHVATKLHVRESGSNTGGVTLSNGTITTNGTNSLTITLSNADRATVAGLTTPQLDIDAGAVSDTSGNTIAAIADQAITISDTTKPTFSSAAYRTGSGELTIAFSEPLDSSKHVPTKMHVRESGSNTGGVTLSNGTITTNGTNSLTITLSNADRTTVAGLTTPQLDIDAGAVSDTSGNAISAIADQTITISDTTKPTFSSAVYKTGSGELTMTFSEPLDSAKHVPTKIHIRESGSNTGGVTLSNGTITTNGTNSLTVTLSSSDRTTVAGLATPQLDIDAGAVSDTYGNAIAAAADQTITINDTIKPTFSSATYKTGSGQLTITFSEPLDSSKHIPTKLHIRESGSNTGGVTLSNGTITTNGTNSLTVTLPNSDRTTVAGLTTPQLDIDAGAVSDTSGNAIAAVSDQVITVQGTDFVTTWRTTSSNEAITIHVSGHTGTYTVNWGDGTNSTTQSGNATHAYASAGSYNVTISGDFERFLAGNSTNAAKLAALVQWGNATWSSMDRSFEYASNMMYKATDAPDLSRVTDMGHMFRKATSFNGDISAWNVSSVTDMSRMFSGASSFNGNLSKWDVSSVTDMSGMFSLDAFTSSFNGDISAWDVSSVTDMSYMFSGAYSFNGDISAWNVSSVTDMSGMFSSDAFTSSFNGDISAWDVSSVTDMSSMFAYAYSFNGNLSAWDVSSVTDMSYMFGDTYSFNGTISNWDVSSVTNMSGMFQGAIGFRTPFNGTISNWDVSSVTDMSGMFNRASFNGDISNWDVSSVTDMSYMFGGSHFNGDISSWDVSSVTDMSHMFEVLAFNGDISAWNVSSVTDMSGMFNRASFNGNISNWNVSSVTDMSVMFHRAPFNGNISNWNVSSVTDMSYMFHGAIGDRTPFNGNISNWDVSSVTDMSRMFKYASFNGNISNWDVSSVTDMSYMFEDAYPFNGDISTWNVSSVTDMSYMFGGSHFNGDISSWDVSSVTDMSGMFQRASFNGDISTWNVSSVTNMFVMFELARSFNGNISNWDVSSVLNAGYMFHNADAFSQNLGPWYVVLDNHFIRNGTLTVGDIAAQSTYFDVFHNPTYSLVAGAGDADNSLFTISGDTLSIKQSPAKSTYHIRIGASGSSLFGSNNAVPVTIINDTTKPTFTSATYKTGSGELTVTFSEPLDSSKHVATKLHVRESGSNTGGVTLSNGTITANGTNSLTITLSNADRTTVAGLTTPQLDIDAGAVSDSAGNQIAAAADQAITIDTTKPTFSSATYTTGSGELTIAFSEALDSAKHVATKLHVRESGSNTGGVTLSNGTITTNGTNSFTITLSNADRTTVAGLTTPQLDIDAGAVSDTSGNAIAAIADQTITILDTEFVTTWRTASSNEAIAIYVGGHTGTYTVNWGDGTSPTTQSGNATHTYASAGSYNVIISGDFERFLAGNSTNAAKLAALVQWGNATWSSMASSFENTTSMIYKTTDAPDLSRVTDMGSMFRDASSFNGNLSTWDVSSVTSMGGMFWNASSFNGDISTWNVSSVTDMSYMFAYATSFNGNLSKWDVSSVTDMSAMFGLASSFNGNISAWDVSSVTDMRSMFWDADSFNNDISNWDVSSVTDMSYMFAYASSFNQNLGPWYVVLDNHFIRNGTLTVGDIAAQSTYLDGHNSTYSLVAGAGDADNSLFTISGDTLSIKQSPAKSTYHIRIGASGGFGSNNAVPVTIINDTTKPTFSSAAYTTGSGQLAITFSEPLDSAKHVATKLHVRESGSNTGGVTLSNGTITTNGTNSLTITLSSSDRTTVAGLTTPQLDIDAGAVSDTSGNQIAAAADQAITINDTTKPTFTSATYKTGSGQLAITFSEPLDASKHVATKLHVRESGSNTGGVTLSNGTITTNGTNSLTITLSSSDRTAVAGLTTPQLDIDAGAVSDTSGNAIAAIADQAITINDTIRPTFSSAAYATGSGQLAITFSEPLDASKHVATKLHVRESGSNTGGVTLSNGTITANGTNSLTITLSSSDRTTVAGLATPQLDIDAGAVSDTSGNAIAAAADQAITINDTIRPTFSSAAYATGSGQLAITFSEPLDASKHVATKLHVRESGSNTGGVTLSNGTITANGTNSLTITLSSSDRTTVAGLTTPQLDIDAGAVSDTSGNQIAAAADQAITINDTTKPTFSSATYKTGSGQLAITFSEPLDASKHVPTKLHIRESGSNTGGVTLSNGTITANGTNSLTITLSSSDRTAVAGLTTPQLDIDAGAVSDTSGNAIAAIADQAITINDTIRPTFSSAAYATGSGQLAITFSEPLDASKHVATKLHVRESGSNTGGVTLSNGTITANGTNSLTITLSSSDRTTVAGLATPQLDIDAGAVSDTSGNAIAAAADQAVTISDTTKPTFSSATYATGSGQLAITFSEPLDASKHVPTKLHVRESGSNTGGVTLSNGTITANGTNSLTLTLSNTDRTAVAGLTTPQLDIDAGAVSDTSGNAIAAIADQTITINDTIKPTFSSAAYATGSGQLAVTFSEPLDSSKHVPTKLHVRESGSNTGGVTLSNGTITANGTNSLTMTLSNADRTAVAGLTTPQLDIDAGAVSDASGNQIAAIADQTITMQDTTKPTFTSATYTTGSGELAITFSEELDSSKHVPTKLHVRESGSNTGGVTLSNGTITANGTNSLTLTLSNTDRTAVAGLTTPQLDIDAGAVSDASGNQIAAIADQTITINDTTKPTFTSATYKTGSGQLAITFSEALDSAKHVPTKLHIRESGSSTGGVTLSNGTITTNGTNSFTITLSNADRTAVAGLTTPQLDIDAGAVSDTSGNAIAAAADRPVTVQSLPPQTVLPPLALLPPVIDPGTPPANGTDAENAPLSTNGTDAGTAPPAANGTLYNATSFSVTLKEGETLAGTVVLGDLGTGVPVSVDLAALEDALPSGSLGSMTLAPARFVPNATVNIEVSSALLGDAPPPAFKPALFFDVNLAGDNFTDPSSFSEYGLPRIKFTVPIDTDIVERFADGCPVTSVYILENGRWGQIGDPRAGQNQIYVANASGASVSVVDITGNQAPRKIGVGTAPRDMALNAQTGLLYVSGSGNVTVIDTMKGRVAAVVDVGEQPVKILVDEPRNSVYAVQAGGNITVINGSTNAVERTITFSGLFSNGTAFDFENMVGYVGDLSKNAILVLDLETGAVTDQIAVDGGPAAIDLDRDGGLVYSSTYGGAVVVINATDNTVIDSVRVGGSPAGLVFNPVNSRVYVGNALSDTVSVIDAHTRTLIRNIPVGNASYGIDLIRSTNTLYVTHPGSGNVTILDGDADAVAGAVGVGIGVQAIEANPDVSNPLRTPAADAIHNGTTPECSYTGGLPHLSKFAVGGIKPTSQPATAVSDDAAAPTFDYAASGDGYNLDVNGNRFRLDSFGAADTQAFGVGEGVTVVFTVMEQGGADDLVHFEFVTNLTGPVRDYAYGDTRLGYDRGAGIQVDDPNGYFADASLTVSDGGGDLVHIAVELAFAKPMASSDVILVMWDENGNSLTASIPDMLEITE